MTQQATAVGGEAAIVTNDAAATASTDPIEALADSWFDDEKQEETPEAGANEDGLTPEDAADDDEQGEGPAIEAPVSWTAEEKDKFKDLPREVQETLARRETERERFVQTKANEAAQARQSAERAAIAQVGEIAQQHVQKFQALLPQVHPKPNAMMQVDDPIAYAEHMQAHEYSLAQYHQVQQAIQGAQTQAQQAEQVLKAQAQQQFHAVLSQEFPDFLDQGEAGAKLRTHLGSIALELGYPAAALNDVDETDVLAMRRVSELKVKADKYDALMAKKMETVREAKGLPRVSRPGAAPTRAQVGQKAVEGAWSRVKETKGRARDDAFADYLGKTGVI